MNEGIQTQNLTFEEWIEQHPANGSFSDDARNALQAQSTEWLQETAAYMLKRASTVQNLRYGYIALSNELLRRGIPLA